MVALGTKWGRKARHRVWLQTLHHAEREAAEAKKPKPRLATFQARLGAAGDDHPPGTEQGYALASSPQPWTMVGENPGYSTPSSLPSTASAGVPIARIVRQETVEQRIWVYGVCVSASLELPPFPQLAAEDLDILQPIPSDDHLLGPSTPFAGRYYVDVASSSECSWWCSQVMAFALGNHPMQPDPKKRVHRPQDMVSTRNRTAM